MADCMSFNVPAVYEVGGGIKGLAKQDRRRQFDGMRRGNGEAMT